MQRGLDKIVTSLRNLENSVTSSAQEPRTSALGNRLATLGSSTIRSLPSTQVVLDNMQHLLDSIQAGAPRSTKVTQNREEEEREQVGRKIQKEYTDQSEGEYHRWHVRQTRTKAGMSRTHQQK